MKISFETTLSPNVLRYQPEKQVFVEHSGHQYKKIGKSYRSLSMGALAVNCLVYLSLRILCLFSSSKDLQKNRQDLFKEISKKQVKTVHYVLRMDKKIIASINNEVQYQISKIDIQSSTVFLKVGNKDDNIRKQYIIKNLDGTSLTQEIFKKQIEQFNESLELEVGEQLTSCNHYSWVILLKDSKNEIHCIHKAINDLCNGHQSWTKNEVAIKRANATLKEMNFPSLVSYVKNQEFIPGEFYQAL